MQSRFSHIGIIGGGALGGALGRRLVTPGVAVTYWDVNPDLRTAASLDDLVTASDLILICTPSQTNHVIASEIAQVATTDSRPAVVSLAKGAEPGLVTMEAVLASELGSDFVTGIISGPMLAAEVALGHTAGATVATTSPAITAEIARQLARAGFIVHISDDPSGVAMAGMFKNVFALALGMSDGLDLGYNFKSVLTVQALTEFRQLLSHFHANPDLAYGMAGLGDLLTTGWSGLSFNWSVGHTWAAGSPNPKGEGFNTLRELHKLINTAEYPIIHTLTAVMLGGENPEILRAIIAKIPPA